MSGKRYSPKEIISKLREAEVFLAEGDRVHAVPSTIYLIDEIVHLRLHMEPCRSLWSPTSTAHGRYWCQSAFKTDPLSASKIDPSFWFIRARRSRRRRQIGRIASRKSASNIRCADFQAPTRPPPVTEIPSALSLSGGVAGSPR